MMEFLITMSFRGTADNPPRPLKTTLSRRGKLGVSCRVKVPVGRKDSNGLRNRMRENCTSGSVWGAPGNGRSYHRSRRGKLGVSCRVKDPVGMKDSNGFL